MTEPHDPASLDWFDAFPVEPVRRAVDALLDSWSQLIRMPRTAFHAQRREPELTRILKAHVERVTARERGVLGMWAAEHVINVIHPDTGEIVMERRADIVYGWNNEYGGIKVVFEFKKLSKNTRSRSKYLGRDGLQRFVTGIYSIGEPVAVMVGILVDPLCSVVPALRDALNDLGYIADLRLRRTPAGEICHMPSELFPGVANFDTEHERPLALASTHGGIRVAHIFLGFEVIDDAGYEDCGLHHLEAESDG